MPQPPLEQLRCGITVEPRQRQFVHAGRVDRRIPIPAGDQHDHVLPVEAARRKEERLTRDGVDPLEVVDDREHRPVIGRSREEAQRRCTDEEAIARNGRTEAKRTGKRSRLRLRDGVEPVGDAPKDVGQRAKRQLRLGFEPLGLENTHPVRALSRIAKERRLADSRLSAQQ